MLLLTGATGTVGQAVLARLLRDGEQVRCLVRDPRRLGGQRVRVQIALGDLADPPSFRHAMRGVDGVVHLASSTRDQHHGSIEELNAIASWRMVDAAQRAGARRFVFLTVLGASTHHQSRFFRAKALAERAVTEAALDTMVFAPSLTYAAGDRWVQLLRRLAFLPAVPICGSGGACVQPIWVDDVAECIARALRRGNPGAPAPAPNSDPAADPTGRHERFELAGPETLTCAQVARVVLAGSGRPRPLVPVPLPIVSRLLRAAGRVGASSVLGTWDQAELAAVPMITARGSADAERLGVTPRTIESVLGVTP